MKKTRGVRRKFATAIAVLTFVSFIAISPTGAQALTYSEPPIKVMVNGLPLESDAAPFIESSSTFVPLRAITEALGCTVDYDASTRLVTVTDGGNVVTLTPGSASATVDGTERTLPAPPMLVNSRTFVPVRFLAESFGCNVVWQDSFDSEAALVKIFGPQKALSGLGVEISSLIYTHSQSYGEHSAEANICLPQLGGLKDAKGQDTINKYYKDIFDGNVDFFEENMDMLDEFMNSPESDEYTYDVTSEIDYYVYSAIDDILTIGMTGYIYMGGAHGMPVNIMDTIDLAASKRLALSDLFVSGADYKTKLSGLMNGIIAQNPEDYEYMFEENISNDNLDEDIANFYFDGEYLVIYYQPYEIAPYAAGFMEFLIEKAQISDILKPEYSK